jgi:DNA-directed RNA polymerase specialized sigma24 family protein
MDDAYQEAFIRLQQHILTERLTADNIQRSLLAYIKEIGYFVAMEIINKRRELPISQLYPSMDDEDEVQHEERGFEYAEPVGDSDGTFNLSKHLDTEERERVIRSLVDQLGAPCAPLLIGFLWKNQSMSELAQELGYSSADSAKTQKSKCMKKVMTFVKQKLIEYGYGY